MYQDGVLIFFCLSKAVMSSAVSTCVCAQLFLSRTMISSYMWYCWVKGLHINLSSPVFFLRLGLWYQHWKLLEWPGKCTAAHGAVLWADRDGASSATVPSEDAETRPSFFSKEEQRPGLLLQRGAGKRHWPGLGAMELKVYVSLCPG